MTKPDETWPTEPDYAPLSKAELDWLNDEVIDQLLDEECGRLGITDASMRDVFKMGARAMRDRVRKQLGALRTNEARSAKLRRKLVDFDTFLEGRKPTLRLAAKFLKALDPKWEAKSGSQRITAGETLLDQYRRR